MQNGNSSRLQPEDLASGPRLAHADRRRNKSKHRAEQRRKQGIFWCITIPVTAWNKPESLPSGLSWIRGQMEQGLTTSYKHWQLVCAFSRKVTLSQCKVAFAREAHCTLSRSSAANEYVWKEDTRISGSQFEFGAKPILRSSSTDWEEVWTRAQAGDLTRIPANVRVVSYRTLRAIAADYACPAALERTVHVYIGSTGTGKSRRAWELGGDNAYPKCPRSKFWVGYQGQENVIIDEFRGGIDIAHLLRWTDRYPVHVETKGGSTPLLATTIYITSNLEVDDWYKDIDHVTLGALKRRLIVTNFDKNILSQ